MGPLRPPAPFLAGRTEWSRTALPLALFLCFAIAAGLGLYALSFLRSVLAHERGDRLAGTAAAVANTLDRIFFERFGDIQLFANDAVLRDGTPAQKIQRLLRYKELYWYYDWLAVTDAHGRIIAATDPSRSFNNGEGEPPWVTGVQSGQVQTIGPFLKDEPRRSASVGFAAPIYDATGRVIEIVVSEIPLERVQAVFEQEGRLSPAGEDPYDWLLVSPSGVIIAEKRPPDSTAAPSRDRLDPRIDGGGDKGYVEEWDPERHIPLLTGFARSKGYGTFPGFSWIVLIRLDRHLAYVPIDRLVWAAGTIGLLIVAPLTGFGIWTSWKLGREHHNLKLARQDLEKSVTELARSNEELQQFAYVASHDLQEPLRMVSSYTQLLAKRYKGKLDSDADDFISFAVEGANRMQKLIQDLLAYSRVSRQSAEPETVSTKTVLDHVLHNLQMALKDSGATVTHDALPTIRVDERQLMQLFQNLLSNAVKFRGPKPLRIHVSARWTGDDWLFSVSDNGIGIDPQYAERIFVIFQRLHTREEYPGTGIGLAICRKIVERHGGRMWVESELGKGATFYFTLRERMEN
jgi:signal transduction histidine kinase